MPIGAPTVVLIRQYSRVALTVSGWGESGARPEPNHDLDLLFASMVAGVDLAVACSVEAAWALVSDIERIGEFSPECVEAHWLPGLPACDVGGRFEGRNRVFDGDDTIEWVRPCTAWYGSQRRRCLGRSATALTGRLRLGGRSASSRRALGWCYARSSPITRMGSVGSARQPRPSQIAPLKSLRLGWQTFEAVCTRR